MIIASNSYVYDFIVAIFMLLLCILMLVCIFVIIMKKQASYLKVTRTDFSQKDNKVNFVHITDLHIPMMPPGIKNLCNTIKDEKPDFVLITGDLCCNSQYGKLEDFLYMLLGKVICPIYITFGNHDLDSDFNKALYSKKLSSISSYIKVLDNECETITVWDRKVCIAGLSDNSDKSWGDDPKEKKNKVNAYVSSWRKKALNDNAFFLLASHNPDILLNMQKNAADLFVCGHLHGGQIWMPLRLEFLVLRHDKMPRKGYIYGRYIFNDMDIFISCGVGCSVFPLRFRSTAEVCVHTI